jgi:hypothetical protein
MRRLVRWSAATGLTMAVFVAIYILCMDLGIPFAGTAIEPDDRLGAALTIASVGAAAVLTPLAWWAGQDGSPHSRSFAGVPEPGGSRKDPGIVATLSGGNGEIEKTRPQIAVGEIPREPPAYQPRPTLRAMLDQALDASKVAVVCTLAGGRGAGKTQLAADYARACLGHGWAVVAWINAEDEGHLTSGLAELADALGIRSSEENSAASAAAARRWLERSSDKTLLVLDNAANADLLVRWLPRVGTTRIIVTSTHQSLGNVGAAIDVGSFSMDEAVAYLLNRTGRDDSEGAARLAIELGCLPLALAQAAWVINIRRMRYDDYITELHAVPVERLLPRARPRRCSFVSGLVMV